MNSEALCRYKTGEECSLRGWDIQSTSRGGAHVPPRVRQAVQSMSGLSVDYFNAELAVQKLALFHASDSSVSQATHQVSATDLKPHNQERTLSG